jgi:PAS domain S-box-containing protein
VIVFTSLLIFGPHATMLVATAGILMRGLSDRQGSQRRWRMLLKAATVMASLQAAGWAHRALGGTIGDFTWPWQAVPIAAGVVGYCIVTSAPVDVLVPLVTKRPINRSWPRRVLQGCPMYFIGASLAVGLVEVIVRESWELLPVAAVPVYLAYRVYRDYENRLEHEHRHREVIDSLTQGMCVVDSSGQVTLWNDALERILDCRRERAVGRSLRGTVPGLAETELPRAIDGVLASRSPRTLPQLGPTSGSTACMLTTSCRSRRHSRRISPAPPSTFSTSTGSVMRTAPTDMSRPAASLRDAQAGAPPASPGH